MKHIPILFSTDMVQAKQSGRKKMTRRTKGLERINANPDEWNITTKNRNICKFFSGTENNPNPIEKYWIFEHCITFEQIEVKCPYGVVRDIKEKSDVLWVRETFMWIMRDHCHDLLEGRKEDTQYVYKASEYKEWIDYAKEKYGYKWRPSIFMTKDACRNFLRVTDVRIERLHEIDDYDAILEGVENHFDKYKDYMKADNYYLGARGSFMSLWASINGKKSWDINPYVWVISFESCDRPTDFI